MSMQIGAHASAVRAHEELFAYWASRREGARLPARSHIHPDDFKRHLPAISLIDCPGTTGLGDYRLRLAGTALYGVYGREITGRTLADVYNTAAAAYWRDELDKVAQAGRPGVGVHSLAWRGSGHLSMLWLRLPLASNGRDVDMILGYDVVIGQHGDAFSGIRAA